MIPFTLERYRIVELYAELLHCSNMSLLNRPATYSHMYDSEGRLQGGLAGLEELAQVIALNSTNERSNESMDESNDETAPALEFPVRNPSEDSPSLDSDDDMSDDDSEDEPGSSDDDAMEEIAMYDDAQLSPIPFASAAQSIPPSSFDVSGLASSPESIGASPTSPASVDSADGPPSLSAGASKLSTSSSNTTTGSHSPDSEGSGMTSRRPGSRSTHGSRRSSRSTRRTTVETPAEVLLPVGEQLKRRWLDENVLGTMIVRWVFSFRDSIYADFPRLTLFFFFIKKIGIVLCLSVEQLFAQRRL
jgi:serine/threonine-protein phosphatase 6 regulatory subunit 3